MNLKNWYPLWLCFLLLFLSHCGKDQGKENTPVKKESLDVPSSTRVKRTEMILIPSPIEIIQVMQQNAKVEPALIINLSETEPAHTSYQKAVMMGILAANIGYMNLRSPAPQTSHYFNRFKQLAEELQITNVFTDDLMQRVEKNRNQLDSLQMLASHTYREVIQALQEAGQEELIHLIIFSGWVEGMRFALESWKKNPVPALGDRIAEQKISLETIESAIKQYPKLYQTLAIPLAKLHVAFQPIQIQYSGKAKTRRVGNRIIVENTNQLVYTKEHLLNLIQAIEEVRSYLLDRNAL